MGTTSGTTYKNWEDFRKHNLVANIGHLAQIIDAFIGSDNEDMMAARGRKIINNDNSDIVSAIKSKLFRGG